MCVVAEAGPLLGQHASRYPPELLSDLALWIAVAVEEVVELLNQSLVLELTDLVGIDEREPAVLGCVVHALLLSVTVSSRETCMSGHA